ncbi:unnamed protein product [Rotaria sordida]|uniref:Uncharacterized protein n=1 Tax=Rotaria sordida TaxID=392033 RepID=A0A819J2C1_9BILA|nr:unnamed protein product [Rotaria sordida]
MLSRLRNLQSKSSSSSSSPSSSTISINTIAISDPGPSLSRKLSNSGYPSTVLTEQQQDTIRSTCQNCLNYSQCNMA